MSVNFVESASAPVKSGKRWLVTIGKPGQGQTAYFTPELWENYGPIAFPPGTASYWKHANPEDRDPRDRLGTFVETFWNAEEQKFQGYLEPRPSWEKVLEEVADLNFSIMCGGEKDEEGVALSLKYHRANSIDAVAVSGIEGAKLEMLVESARADFTPEPVTESAGEKETKMDKELADAFAKQTSILESILGMLNDKAASEAQVEADQTAISEALEAYAGNVALIESARADLLPAQVTALQESAKTSTSADFARLVESAKTVAKEAKEAVLAETATGFDAFGKAESVTDLGKVFG